VLDPELFEVGPQRVKTFADKNEALITAGDEATLLKEGPAEAIVERIKLYIDKMARGERCMIHLNQIPAETPPDHIHAAVAACQTYGQYSIPENLADVPFEMPKRESFADFMHARRETISS
jgi:hypothetical protein